MRELVEPGGVSSRLGWLICGACAVTVALAAYGMQALLDCIEWVHKSWGGDGPVPHAFWYQHGIALAITLGIALAWLPAFRISRLLRVAVLLPVLQLGAIIAAASVWSMVSGDGLAALATVEFLPEFMKYVHGAIPPASMLVLAFAAMVAVGICIKRRHGEWAHATVMLALSFLLLLGLWLPIVARFAVATVEPSYGWPYTMRVLDPDIVARAAIVPAATLAVLFVVFAFRCPRLYARWRHLVRPFAVSGLVLALLFAVSLPDKSWLVYLESSYLVMVGVVLAVASLVLLATITWSRSRLAHRSARGLARIVGVIANDDQRVVAQYEVTSTLRGPLLVSRPFVVTTKDGDLPISGARLLVPVPARSTALEIGEHVPVLGSGHPVELAVRETRRDGHPFRASGAAEIVSVMTPDAHPYRFSDVVLVVWRPAVAYLAILLAVAAPYLTIFLTD